MQNMYTMLASENYVSPDEIADEREFNAWVKAVENIRGEKIDVDGIAWDLFMDGCDAEDAATELNFH